MTLLDNELITYLANLSKIEISEDEKTRLVSEMSDIVALMDTVNEVNIDEDEDLKVEGVLLEDLREDKVKVSESRAEVLSNAVNTKDGFFVVPKIME